MLFEVYEADKNKQEKQAMPAIQALIRKAVQRHVSSVPLHFPTSLILSFLRLYRKTPHSKTNEGHVQT